MRIPQEKTKVLCALASGPWFGTCLCQYPAHPGMSCLDGAIKKLKPVSKRGPWTVLCDGESFLHCPESREAHRKVKVKLWQIPAKSPDLNPIDFFWAWMRRELRARDFADLRAKRPVLGKMAYKQRVVNVLRSAKAQRHAAACVRGLRKVCREVSLKGGAASRG